MDNLPLKVDSVRFAENAVSLQGRLFIKDMPRLLSSVRTGEGSVMVKLQFGMDHQGIKFMTGHFESRLTLECQRCMGLFEYEVENDFTFAILTSEKEAKTLPATYDPLFVHEGMLNVADLIEEELIVSLPIVAMHSIEQCKVKLPFSSHSNEAQNVEKENPFKVVELLRRKRDTKSSD